MARTQRSGTRKHGGQKGPAESQAQRGCVGGDRKAWSLRMGMDGVGGGEGEAWPM